MMRSVKITLLLILLSGWNILSAQPSHTQKFLPVLAPPSPEAAAFEKYGNYEVNIFTGVPAISIPIYEVRIGELSVPISLSYHASGIRVNEIPSRIGLGWDLQAGGAVTRKIMGRPDELEGNYLSATASSVNRVRSDINPYSQADLDYLNNVDRGIYDVEPDVFSYAFPGHAGKFVFNQKNNFTPFFIPYAPLAVAYSKPNVNTLVLGITDESGIVYRFDSTEWTNFGGGVSTNATSAWLLNEMISANKQDSIHFRYVSRTGGGITDSYFSDYVVVTDNSQGGFTSDFGISYSDQGSVNTLWKRLTEIVFRNGKVVFEEAPEGREDFSSQYQLQHRLNAIKIYNYNVLSNSFSLLRSVQFFHSYFISGTDAYTKRLRLDSIQIKDAVGIAIQTYRFNYNTSIALPSNTSRKKDYWGYFNNVDNKRSDGVPTMVPRMQVDYLSVNNPPTSIWIGGDHTNARDPDPNYMQACILQKITYPAGGFSEFEYETNKYLDNLGSPKFAGGLRIKSIKNYSIATAGPVVRTFKYGENESGYGRNNFLLENHFFVSAQNVKQWEMSGLQCASIESRKRVRTFFANPTNDLEGYDGAAVVYSEVTEYLGNEIANTGKTVYKFSDKADAKTNIIGYGKPILDSYHFVRGLLANKTDYRINTDNISYTRVSETRRKYQYFPFQWSTGGLGLVVLKSTIIGSGNFFCGLSCAYTSSCGIYSDSYNYSYNNYDIITGDNKLVIDSSFVYDQNDPAKYNLSIANYTYDDVSHLQIIQTQTTNSKGEALATTYTYPYNYPSSPYLDMTNNHIYNKVVQETQTNNGNLLFAKTNNLQSFAGSNYLPANVQLKIKSNPLETRALFNQYDPRGNILEMQKAGDAKQSFIWDYQNLQPIAEVINAGQQDIAYTSFESDGTGSWTIGNTLRKGTGITGRYCYNMSDGNISKSGLTPSTIYVLSYWSRNGSYSISGGTGASPLQGRNIDGWTHYQHEITASASTVTISGNGLIDELRLYPKMAQMTSYCYEPLIGMTSQCDGNNRIMYYEYDAFNRLTVIRDQDRNVIKRICYNYAGQPENCSYYYNPQVSQVFTRQCAAGYVGSQVTYTVPSNKYGSSISAQDALAKAQADINANGQPYANANGTCTQLTIYARIELTDIYQDFYDTWATVWICFYSDAACTQPVTVNSLTVNYRKTRFNCSGSQLPLNLSKVCSGTQTSLGNQLIAVDDDFGLCYSNVFMVTAGTGYTLAGL